MAKQAVSAALERLEGVAAEFLENEIAMVEQSQHVQITGIEVALTPGRPGDSPAVTVVVRT